MQPLTSQDLIQHGLDSDSAAKLVDRINALIGSRLEDELWRFISQQLLTSEHPFELHRFLFDLVYAGNDPSVNPPPAWMPTEKSIASTNLGRLMADLGLESVSELHTWSVQHRAEFWRHMTQRLDISFQRPMEKLVDLADGIESPRWLSGAKLNIVDSCFRAEPEAVAIVLGRQGDELSTVCYGELEALTNRVANGLLEAGFSSGEGIAIAMPMTVESVAAYLGIIRAGLIAVSIADSLASEEIAVRFRIADAKGVLTQDFVSRTGKRIPLYERVISAGAPRAVR